MPYEDMGGMGQAVPPGSWEGPPPAGPVNPPEAVAAMATEMNGAAYRVQKQSWAPQLDAQIPYGNGFIAARTSQYFGQTQPMVEGMVDRPNAGDPLGTEHAKYVSEEMRPRSTGNKIVGNEGGGKADRQNVPNTNLYDTNESPSAGSFRYGGISGR